MFYLFEPKPLEEKKVFDGKIKVKCATHKERLDYLKQIQILANDEVEKIKFLHDVAKKHIVEVDLKRIEDGLEIKDIELFEYDNDLSHVLLQIAANLLEGQKLGKHLLKT